jgi:hypothetical protein
VAAPEVTVDLIERLLSANRFRYSDEADLQVAIASILAAANIAHVREYRLDERDRPDFYIPAAKLVIEVKCNGALDPALRQVDRYMAHEEVQAVVLAAGRAWGRCTVDNAAWRGKSFALVFLRRVI